MAVGSSGRAITVFLRTPAGSAAGAARVQVTMRASTVGAWSKPLVLSQRGARAPRVAINARGDAAVVWVSGRSLVAAARRGPVGRWSPAGSLVAAGPIQDFRLAIDRVGRPALVWSERDGDDYIVRTANRASPKVRWTVREARISTPGPVPPSLAISRAAALVAWVNGSDAHASRTVGGMFESPMQVSSQAAGAPGAALSPLGAMLAAWSVNLPGGTSVVLVSERGTPSRQWASSEDAGIGSRPLAAINERGDAVVSWALAAPGSAQGIEASTRRTGGRWEASTVVARRTCSCALTVGDVAVDGTGTALVAWRLEDGRAVGSGGVSSLGAGADDWARASVSPGRTEVAPVVAGGSRGGLAAWAESGAGGGVRTVTLRPVGFLHPG